MRVGTYFLCITILALARLDAAPAAEIYRWVGADGVVHYSDAAPADDIETTTLEIDDSRPADYDPQADPYSILNQARRLEAARAALVEARLEREQAARQAPIEPAYAPGMPYAWPQHYVSGWYYPTPVPPRHPLPRPYAGLRQLQAMDQLELKGPRPASINSGVHRERVERSAALPIVPVRLPRQPGAGHH